MSLNLDKSTWRRVKFGDVIDSITDRVDDPSSAGVDRYVGLEHLDPGVLTVERWDSPDKVEAQKLRFQPGDVIFGRRRAYQKKVARADFEGSAQRMRWFSGRSRGSCTRTFCRCSSPATTSLTEPSVSQSVRSLRRSTGAI
ncbi:hypothetical protein [Tessaracoccus coleopterorum]|uniref:hypothetical protein n=1 Tax=Tessaracoccus coleopterorum TaxID=2714950 RepID=UPI0018D44FE0|nr:hypothetical protein [Tessaracoccus coleopterorum]